MRLFYGSKSGVEALYMNEFRRDMALYYDEESFRAFEAISPRPHYDAPPEIDRVLIDNAHEIWDLIQQPNTYVYLAGLSAAASKFETAMEQLAGGAAQWQELKNTIATEQRFAELLYD